MTRGANHYPANKFSNSPFLCFLHLAWRLGARDKKKNREVSLPYPCSFPLYLFSIRAQRSPKELARKAVLGDEFCPSFLCKLVITNKEEIPSFKTVQESSQGTIRQHTDPVPRETTKWSLGCLHRPLEATIGTLRSNDADGNENVKLV